MEWIEKLIHWLLGLATLGLIGILSMNVRLSVLRKELELHKEICSDKHRNHEKEIEELRHDLDDHRLNHKC